MAGNSNSGNKSLIYNQVRALVINNCWDEIATYLERNPGLKKKYKRALVLEVIKKTIPTDINLNGKIENIISLSNEEFTKILEAYVNKRGTKDSSIEKDI